MTTAGFLGGLRVLELGEMVAAPYCAKLLGDLGADVVKVEGPGGDRARRVGPFVGGVEDGERSILFLHCNTSKRSVCLDVDTEPGAAAFAELAARADLVVTDRRLDGDKPPGLGTEALLAAQPALVVLELTPFGASGPYKDFKAYPLNTFHAAGEGYLTPVASYLMPEVVDRPPLRQGRFAAEYKLATYAATLALGAVGHARATGVGQYIECSKQDLLLGLNFFEFQGWLSTGVMPTRANLAVPFGGIMPCKDGYLQFTFHEEHQWRALVKLMGHPDWASEEWAATTATRGSHAAEINARLEEWLSTRTRDEVVRDGQQMGCTVAPYQSVAEVASSIQFEQRHFFQPVAHPVAGTHRYPTGAWRFSGVRPCPGPAPLLGQHDDERPQLFLRERDVPPSSPHRPRQGPLAGLRVVDFTWAVAGPTATMVLACFGAEVIKVETSLRLDVLRRSGYIGASTNRQKKAVTLDLRHPKAVTLAKRLVGRCDVVAESFRPGVMDGLGLGYDALRAVKPDIVMLSSSMAGQTGPLAHFAGYAPMFVALSGLGDMTGYPDGPPTQIRVGGDIIVGVHAAFALMAAILHHQATGQGCHIDLSAIESQASLIGDSVLDYTANGAVPRRSGNHEPDVAPHNCYRCAGDDQWISIVVATEDEWQALVEVMGTPTWARSDRFSNGRSRQENAEELDRHIEAWTLTRPPAEVMTQLQAAGVAAMPSYRAPELFADPHVMFRDMVTEVPSGDGSMPVVRLGGRFAATPMQLDRAGPAMGEHNDEVFRRLLGLSDDEMDALAADGVFT